MILYTLAETSIKILHVAWGARNIACSV